MDFSNAPFAKLPGDPEADSPVSAFLACFNQQRYLEAHDVLEQPWLQSRGSTTGQFYQGLIQLAAAFVHLQRHSALHPRLEPACRLLRRACLKLEPFQPAHQGLDVQKLLDTMKRLLRELETTES